MTEQTAAQIVKTAQQVGALADEGIGIVTQIKEAGSREVSQVLSVTLREVHDRFRMMQSELSALLIEADKNCPANYMAMLLTRRILDDIDLKIWDTEF